MDEHGLAFAFDLWTRARIRLSELGESVTYGAAWMLLQGFLREWGTHTQAAVSGWEFVAGYGEVMQGLHYRGFLLANSDEKGRSRVEVPLPWSDAAASAESVTDEEMDAVLARLEAVSAIRD